MAKVIWYSGTVEVKAFELLMLMGLVLCLGNVVFAEETVSAVTQQYNQGMDYLNAGQYTQAQEIFESLAADISDKELDFSSQDGIVDVVYLLADCYRKEKDDRAIELYQYILSKHPSHNLAVQAQSGMARCYIQKKDNANAQAAIEKLLTDYSDHPDIANVIGRLADNCRGGKTDRAFSIVLYQYFVNTYPSHNRAMQAQSRLAICYIRQKEDSKAQAAIEKLLANYSDHPDIVECIIGIVERYRKEQGDKAIPMVLYQYVISNYPSHNWAVRAQSGLIKCYLHKEDKKTAQAEVEKLLADYSGHPEFVEVIVDLAGFCRKERANQIAIGLYQHILTKYPSHNLAIKAQAGLAKYYIRRKDHTNAQAAIDKLLTDYSAHPDIAKVIGGLADYCSNKNDTDMAIELYQHIASGCPSHNSAMGVQFRLIKNYMSQKDYIKAQAAIDKLLTDYSDHPDIVKVIGNIADSCREENTDIAIELYQHILSEYPSHNLAVRAQSGLAKCYIQKNDDSKAQAAVEKLLADYSAHPDIVKVIWYLADSCRTKNADKAIELYRYITNLYPSHDLAVQAQSDLAKCYIQKNDYAMALYCIDSATKDYPDHKQIAWFLKAKADCYFNMGAENQVEEVVDEILQSHLAKEGKHGILRGVAMSYRNHGNYEGSLNLCKRVLDNNPCKFERLRAYTGIAMSYIGLGDDPNVIETLNTICADFADHSRLVRAIFVIGEEYYNKAEKAASESNEDLAKSCYQKAISIWAKKIAHINDSHFECDAHYFSAIAFQRMGKYEEAISGYKDVIASYPQFDRAWNAQFMIAVCYDKLRKSNQISIDEARSNIIEACQMLEQKYPDSKAKVAAEMLLKDYNTL